MELPKKSPPVLDPETVPIKAAWDILKPKLQPPSWTVGESFTYYGFFAWGWEARRQYDANLIDPTANIQRFKQAYDELVEKNWVVRNLLNGGMGYDQLPAHLKKDADKRMGIVRWVNVPIFENDTTGEEQ